MVGACGGENYLPHDQEAKENEDGLRVLQSPLGHTPVTLKLPKSAQ